MTTIYKNKRIKQELFNRTWRRFVINKEKPSYDKVNKRCLYRGPNGTKCAIGSEIPDEDLPHHFEGISAVELITRIVGEKKEASVKKLIPITLSETNKNGFFIASFVNIIQAAHDNVASATEGSEKSFYRLIKDELKFIAADYKLKIPS